MANVFSGVYVGKYVKPESTFNGKVKNACDVLQINVVSRNKNFLIETEVPLNSWKCEVGQKVTFNLDISKFNIVRPIINNLKIVADDYEIKEINDVAVDGIYYGKVAIGNGKNDKYQVGYRTSNGKYIIIDCNLPKEFIVNIKKYESCTFDIALKSTNGQTEVYARALRRLNEMRPKVLESNNIDDEELGEEENV